MSDDVRVVRIGTLLVPEYAWIWNGVRSKGYPSATKALRKGLRFARRHGR